MGVSKFSVAQEKHAGETGMARVKKEIRKGPQRRETNQVIKGAPGRKQDNWERVALESS